MVSVLGAVALALVSTVRAADYGVLEFSTVSYVVSGYSLNDVAVESLTPADGKITLTVKHGSDVTIHALPYGERNPSTGVTTFHRYTVTEFSFNSGYTVTGTDTQGNTVKQLVLDAVYSDVTTVRLTLDGNGATLDSDYTGSGFTLDDKLQSDITATPSGDSSTLTVTGMRNNSFGQGYRCVTLVGRQVGFPP